jgi:hypothetical protein
VGPRTLILAAGSGEIRAAIDRPSLRKDEIPA